MAVSVVAQWVTPTAQSGTSSSSTASLPLQHPVNVPGKAMGPCHPWETQLKLQAPDWPVPTPAITALREVNQYMDALTLKIIENNKISE